MQYTKERAEALRQQHGLSKYTLYRWSSANHIPDRYNDPGFAPRRRRRAAHERTERTLRRVLSHRDPLLRPAALKPHLKNQARLDYLNKAWGDPHCITQLDYRPLLDAEAEAIATDLSLLHRRLTDLEATLATQPFDGDDCTQKLRDLLRLPVVNRSALARRMGGEGRGSLSARLLGLVAQSARGLDENKDRAFLIRLGAVVRPLRLTVEGR